MNLENLKAKAIELVNTKVGTVLGLYFSLRLAGLAGQVFFEGGVNAAGVILAVLLIIPSWIAFGYFYERIEVKND